MKVEVKLTKVASGSGGDRYEGMIPEQTKPWVIYVPQSVSRSQSGVAEKLTIEITP